MPSLHPKLQKMLLCNPKLLFFNYKSYKNFQDTKYCTFHRSVITVSFSNLSYKIIYTCWHKVSKHCPPNLPYKRIPPLRKKKSYCHFFLWDIYNENAPFSTNMGHLDAHAERNHYENLPKSPEKEIKNL